MKKGIILFMMLLSASYFISCEKDDICAEGTPTTPSLVIRFFEDTNRSQPKNVTNLRVIAEGMETGVPFGTTDVTSASTIQIPLRTDADQTVYRFIHRATATDGTTNEDRITFNYTRNEIYVSRACGYKTHFNLTSTNPDVAAVYDPGTDGPWIAADGITIERTNIEDENEAHINIYF
jgi:hypothetical protein